MDGTGNISNDGTRDGRGPGADGTGAAERLRQAAAAAASGRGSRQDLQAAARALVEDLRRQQEPPEQVLLKIKEHLAEAGLRPGFPADGDGGDVAASLYRDMITWSIRYYYEDRAADGR